MSSQHLRCGICMERFNQNERKPKFLQCYHTYCLQCLTKIQEKRNTTSGGGVQFPCPSCRKTTPAGKKGVEALQDNFYLYPLCNDGGIQDEIYQSDEEEDSITRTVEPTKKKMTKMWCNTCLKVAGPDCSLHDICNLEEGKRHLEECLQATLELANDNLAWEVRVRKPQLALLQAAHQAWTSGLTEQLTELINAKSMALTVARSELESVKSFSRLEHEDDPSILAGALKQTEAILANALDRLHSAERQSALLTALQMCRIRINPTLDSHDKDKHKLRNLEVDITGNGSNEEKVLIYLLSHVLEQKNKNVDPSDVWHVVKGKNKDDSKKSQSSKVRSSSVRRSGGRNLLSTMAVSTESLPVMSGFKAVATHKGPGCFFDIAINGELRGRVVIALRPDMAPKMCANFVALCTGELGYGYKGSKIFKALANDHIVGGDFQNNDGTGGHSIYNNKGLFVADRMGLKDEVGAIRMRGMGTDQKSGGGMVGSQFHIWVGDRDFRPFVRTLVIGKVVEGLDLCKTISNIKTYKNNSGTFIISNRVVIQNCGRL